MSDWGWWVPVGSILFFLLKNGFFQRVEVASCFGHVKDVGATIQVSFGLPALEAAEFSLAVSDYVQCFVMVHTDQVVL